MRVYIVLVSMLMLAQAAGQSPQRDTAIEKASKLLSERIDKKARKKLAILDVVETDGRTCELGRLIADQLTIEMTNNDHNFVLVDEANRARLIERMRESNSGVFKPEDVKKLGNMSGADTILSGKLSEAGGMVTVNFTISTIDSGEIIGGTKMSYEMTESDRVGVQRSAGMQSATVAREEKSGALTGLGTPKAATDKRFSAKKTVWSQGVLEAVLTNFVMTETDSKATVKLKNSGRAPVKIGLDWNTYNAAQVRAGYSSIYVGPDGAGFTAALTDSSGFAMVFTDVRGIEISGFKSIGEALYYNRGDDVARAMGALSDLPAGGEMDIVLSFRPPSKKMVNASDSLGLDMNFRLQVGLYYSEVRQQGVTRPVRATPTFEDIRPRQ